MPVIVRDGGGGEFTPAPAGQWPVVCCDVADLGDVDTQWGKKHKVRLYWMLAQQMDDGRPFICAKQYTASLNEKSNLRRDLEAWRGRPFTEEELDGFDLERLIGAPALVNIIHNKTERGTYANVNVIMRLPKGMQAPPIDPGYVRWQDRDANKSKLQAAVEQPEDDEPPFPDDDEPPPMDDDDIPF